MKILNFLKNHKFGVLLITLLLVSAFIRFYKLTDVPSSLYYDEVDLGYQARSLMETYKDYRNKQSLFYELTFNDPKTPLPIILSIPATLIFSNEEMQVRATPAVMGVIVVLFAFLITNLLTKKFWPSFIVAAVFATNPWQIQFSRFAIEGIFSVAFYMMSIYFFLKAVDQKKLKFLIISAVLFSLTVCTYRTMSLFVPLTLFALFVIYRKELFQFGLRKLLINIVIIALITIPFYYFTTIGAPDIPRISQISITSDKLIPILIQRDRELDSNDFADPTIGKSANKLSYIFHNKPLSYTQFFTQNYLETFSVEFLFLTGTLDNREGVGDRGELFYIDIFALIAGVYFIIEKLKNGQKNLSFKNYLLVITILLLAPIPSALTIGGAKHGSRLFIFSVPLLIIVGLGWWKIISSFKRLHYSQVIYSVLGFAWILSFIFYAHHYLVEYPILSAPYFGYGFKQLSADINKLGSKYNYVYLTSANDPPMIYLLFWLHIPPSELQAYGSQFNVGQDLGSPLDKYKVLSMHVDNAKDEAALANNLEKGILYVYGAADMPVEIHNQNEAPKGVNVVDIIRYPNNTPAFYLLEKI